MSRVDQINELLRAELANLIARESPLDNGLITITYVKCSPDLRTAKAFISVLPENMSGTALKKLKSHSGQFASILKKKIKIKFIPRFNWLIDQQERHAAQMDKIIDEAIKTNGK